MESPLICRKANRLLPRMIAVGVWIEPAARRAFCCQRVSERAAPFIVWEVAPAKRRSIAELQAW